MYTDELFTKSQLVFHRGWRGLWRVNGEEVFIEENSLPAFTIAIEVGATMIEFDARRDPAGGRPIIAHDPHKKGPTVEQAIHMINRRCAINIEIKDPSIWETIVEIVEDAIVYARWTPEQFVISSFHHDTVFRIKKALPIITVGAIMDAVPHISYLDILAAHDVSNLHMEYMNAAMDMQNGGVFMKRAQELGMHVWAWTVNDRPSAISVHTWGAERIFTDKPHLFMYL